VLVQLKEWHVRCIIFILFYETFRQIKFSLWRDEFSRSCQHLSELLLYVSFFSNKPGFILHSFPNEQIKLIAWPFQEIRKDMVKTLSKNLCSSSYIINRKDVSYYNTGLKKGVNVVVLQSATSLLIFNTKIILLA
jgi:hypothetical protein